MPMNATSSENIIGITNGIIGITIKARKEQQKIKLTVRVPELAQESILNAVLPKDGKTYTLYPQIHWNFKKLRRLREPMPVFIEYQVELEGETAVTQLHPVRVRSINDAPYFVQTPEGGIDLSWMFAAYVNEDHPLVQSLLTSALKTQITRRFDGYQSGKAEDVYRQVFALWHVLQKRGIRYSSITNTSSVDDTVYSQHVRFIDESWDSAQANCVDGSVLLASLLRKIGLNPKMIMLPGHMILAFDLDLKGKKQVYLETTLLGTVSKSKKNRLAGLHQNTNNTINESTSLASFEAAVAEGFTRHHKAASALALGKDPRYQIIDIKVARNMGIIPIASK
jgi:hypothetical protein